MRVTTDQGFQGPFFYSCEGWSGAGECPLNKASSLEIHWHGQTRYDNQTEERTFSHHLTFCANSAWVNARADDQRIRLERVWLALAMGWHKRLGSQIGNINSDVLLCIHLYLKISEIENRIRRSLLYVGLLTLT